MSFSQEAADNEESKSILQFNIADAKENVSLDMDIDRLKSLSNYTQIKQSVGLSWKDLEYVVKDKNNKGKEKKILTKVSGYIEPGKVLCILGPSGSGKTTLLQILAGLRTTTNGEIVYNGKAKKESKISNDIMGYEGNAAYIAQEDTGIHGSLTVRESLQYAAMLKTSNKSLTEREELVNSTIEYLGLSSCADTIVGNIFFKGISGGQKRRVSIGVELMSQPSLLFMDEITSGLDSTSSYKIMELLDALSQKGHTIILTIHQPSSRIFDMMSKRDFSMMVLESGRTMYFGKVRDLVPYLAKIKYQIPQFSNPCDHILDLVNCDFQNSTKIADDLNKFYNEHIKETLLEKVNDLNIKQSKIDVSPKKSAFIGKQILILLKRNFKNDLRNPMVYWMRIAMYSMLCLCLGSLYWDIGTDASDIQDRISILFFVAAFLVFMAISGMPAFVEERAIFIRERINNHYCTFAYCIANFLSSLPWIFLISLVCSAIIYEMIQSRSGGDVFGIYLANLFVTLLVAESLVVALSGLSSEFMVGISIGSGIFGIYMINCGFFLIPSNIPSYWYWFHKGVSFHTYTFTVFMKNEFEDFNEGQIDGNAVLKQYEMDNISIGLCFGILIIMMFVYRVLFYVILRFLNRRQN